MVGDFPWPVTDDELVLDEALAVVMDACEPHGSNEDDYIRAAAAKLIVEAFNQGIRDPQILSHYALKALHEQQADRMNGGRLS
ncbi:MAG TPA: hypothetical protein VFL62_11140 [Bradyrhizobium sp.]|uniref:hypothetical protein n=1 Tax=Bradyrhizobium sp. TaxID=376 RepID=UPI002D803DF9|nr:hypothetical protein [Bradyrhizobium sp.]HET7886772.1 hypothetical protein [Bradyrhizobium sp.]